MVCNLSNILYADTANLAYTLLFIIRSLDFKRLNKQKAKHISGGQMKYGQSISQIMIEEIFPSF